MELDDETYAQEVLGEVYEIDDAEFERLISTREVFDEMIRMQKERAKDMKREVTSNGYDK